MTDTWTGLADDELGALLTDLGHHLEPGPDASMAVRVAVERRPRRTVPRWLVAAAIVVVTLAVTLAVAPAREAVARWLGIGAVQIETGTPGATAPSSTLPPGFVDVHELESDLPFELRLFDPGVAGDPLGARVDPAVPTGRVEIRYEDATLVEVASEPGGSPVLGKIVGGGTELVPVDVRGGSGFWITGDPHDLAYVAPDGTVRSDTVRQAGDVLLWAEDGVTYRIEGAASLDIALELASSLH